MKKIYNQPTVDIEDVMVEHGIATSPYGDYGAAGQDSDYIDAEDDFYL